jgi:hypothetical protein
MEPQFITMSACSSDAPHDGRLPPGLHMGISALFFWRFAKHWGFDSPQQLAKTNTKTMGFDQRLDEAKMGIFSATSRSKWKLWNTKGNYDKTPGILET